MFSLLLRLLQSEKGGSGRFPLAVLAQLWRLSYDANEAFNG